MMTVQQRSVMKLRGDGPMGSLRFDNDPEEITLLRVFYIPRDDFEAMGSPEVVTVSVVPGDELNKEDEIAE